MVQHTTASSFCFEYTPFSNFFFSDADGDDDDKPKAKKAGRKGAAKKKRATEDDSMSDEDDDDGVSDVEMDLAISTGSLAIPATMMPAGLATGQPALSLGSSGATAARTGPSDAETDFDALLDSFASPQ